MKKWSILVVIAIVALLMPVTSTIANAQDEAGLSIEKSADKTSASPHETITYTYTLVNTDNSTVSNITLEDDKLGTISLTDTTLASGGSITATATYTVTISDMPGPIVNTATVTGTDPEGILVSATTDPVSVSLCANRWLLFKAEIFRLMGIRGKGIEKAPGLQKPFNIKSQAAERIGIKEQLRIRQMTENHCTVKEQLRIRQMTENHCTVKQLKIKQNTSNQLQNNAGKGL